MKLRLKRLGTHEEYDLNECAASRCMSGSDLILASKKLVDIDIGLCDYHWLIYCEKTGE